MLCSASARRVKEEGLALANGHRALPRLWARLLSHCWATAIFEDAMIQGDAFRPDPVAYMQKAYEKTLGATQAPNDWQGTTTATGALLHYRSASETDLAEAQQQEQAGAESSSAVPGKTSSTPLLYVTNLGDSQVMVVRPTTRELVFKSAEQWHWFDCPRQLGTNSPDTPQANATLDAVAIREGDVVLAMTDGVIDNLWAHEIVEKVSESVAKWRDGAVVAQPGWHCGRATGDGMDGADANGMAFVAHELMEAAKAVALDPFAESPFMERAIEEGLPSEGGKSLSGVGAGARRAENMLTRRSQENLTTSASLRRFVYGTSDVSGAESNGRLDSKQRHWVEQQQQQEGGFA